MDNTEKIRLLVPVLEDTAAEVECMGKCLDRSTSWMAAKLIQFECENQKKLVEWLGAVVLGTARTAAMLISGKRRRRVDQQKEVRLQVMLPLEVNEKVEKLAERLRESPVKTAGRLIEAGVHHNELIVEFLGQKFVKGLWGKLKPRSEEKKTP